MGRTTGAASCVACWAATSGGPGRGLDSVVGRGHLGRVSKSSKQRREELRSRREAKRQRASQERLEAGLADGSILPVDASKIVSRSAIPDIPDYYRDRHFHCKDCGKGETWTAAQQKRWHEEQGGEIEAIAVRCRDCRRARRDRRSELRESRIAVARGEAEGLVAEIEQAFAGIEKPRITLAVAMGYDDEWVLSERRVEELRATDPEESWQEITAERVRGHHGYFTFADAAGWRFYLPAFMVLHLRGFPGGWNGVDDACAGPNPKFESLDRAQRRCVDRFLEFCRRWRELSS